MNWKSFWYGPMWKQKPHGMRSPKGTDAGNSDVDPSCTVAMDFAAASHGASFHAPLEVSRIISNGIEKAQEARIKLSRVLASLGKNAEIPMPDIASKEKAQTFIGLDMKTLRKDKAQFLKMLPQIGTRNKMLLFFPYPIARIFL